MNRTANFLQARGSEQRAAQVAAQNASSEFVTPMKLRKIGNNNDDYAENDDLQNYLDTNMNQVGKLRTQNNTPSHQHTQSFKFAEQAGQSAVFKTLAKRYRGGVKRGLTPTLVNVSGKRSPLGHDAKLDDINLDKIVSHNPIALYYRQRAAQKPRPQSQQIQIEV